MERMKAAVIGCGRMGARPASVMEGKIPAGWLPLSHIESISAVPGVTLEAVCDTERSLLDRWSQHYRVPQAFTDYRELIDRVKPDVITLATRTPVKKEILEYACARGVKGIYVEKPIANSIADCEAILSLAKRSGVQLALGVQRRYHSVYRQAREMIRSGVIGDRLEVVVEHGRAEILWAHPHALDLMLFLADSPDVHFAQASLAPESVNRVAPLKIDSDPIVQSAFFQFANGTKAHLVGCGGSNVKIGGTKGNLTICADGSYIQIHQNYAESPYHHLEKTIFPLPGPSCTVTGMTEWVDSIRSQGKPPITPEEIEMGCRMAMGMAWSHVNDGRRVPMREIPTDLFITGRSGNLYA